MSGDGGPEGDDKGVGARVRVGVRVEIKCRPGVRGRVSLTDARVFVSLTLTLEPPHLI